MGVEKTYEGDDNVGLLGYSHGKQSIFLDAKTGNATFGLPGLQEDGNERYQEGRIELRPGGTSKIGNWKIGSRTLYNVVDGDIGEPYLSSEQADGHLVDIPHKKQGILLSAEPAYISIKGRVLTDSDISKNANRVINPGDSLEIQLDPAQQSLFTIFRHYPERDGNGQIIYDESGNEIWHRKATVGIDRQGRFYSNALRQEATTLAIGFVGGLGKTAIEEKYIGVSVDVDDTTIWKMFSSYNDGVTADSTLYLSGGTTENDDYQRPIQVMGKELNLRTSSNDDNSRINMTTTAMMLGQKNAKISLNNTTGNLVTSGAFTRTIGGLNTETLNGGSTINIAGALTQTITGNTSITTANSEIRDSDNRFRISGKTQGNVTPYDFLLSRNGTNDSY